MKVLYCQEPNNFQLREEDIPSPAKGEALLKITRIGICGTDIHAYHGNQPFFTYPRVLGHELCGEIVELKEEQHHLKVGDRVTIIPYLHCGDCVACRNHKPNCCTNINVLGVHIDGGMKEYMTIPATHLLNVNKISPDSAAMVEPLSIGAHAVRRTNLGAGQTALVIGAGPIGLAVMRFAKLTGANVIAMDINYERLQFCKEWAKVDSIVTAGDNALAEIEKLTNGEFPTVVFDVTGNQTSMNQAIHFVSHGGQLVYVGLIKGDITFSDLEFHKREMSLLASRNATLEDFHYVIDCIEKGFVDTDALISIRTKLSDLVNDFSDITNPKNKVIKALIELE
ncbi:zinc-binding alcohol dehydrogenase family protein [bacterium LRH843]|nr:zinc-binding alcohol dehydrogenase family protein [bacterium LRH843]